MMKLLFAEDEVSMSEAVVDILTYHKYIVDAVYDGDAALDYARATQYDGIILDIMMPKLDGLSVCRAVRKNNDVPIVFLTALSDEEDKLMGYELGADDYVTKPFTMSVLYAKLMALIKRNQRNVLAGDRMEAGGITLDLARQKAFTEKREITLTPKEFALLRCLMQNKNMVMSREQLLIKCWGYDYDGESRAVDTHIKRLREKLGEYAACIKTVIKAGYRLEG